MTSILYFPLKEVKLHTGFVWLMIGTVNILRPTAVIFCQRRVLCFGLSFVLGILYVAMQ